MNYEIRRMKSADSHSVISIFKQGIDGGNATFDKDAPNWENWDVGFFHNCRWVVEDENENVVGWAALKPVSNRECFKGVAEVSIYLDNSVQGRGLGSVLMKKLILDSEEQGFWTLQSGIFPENEASIAIHSKLGFRIVGTREKLAEMDGRWRAIVLMERRSAVI